jgi:hypothetical protein
MGVFWSEANMSLRAFVIFVLAGLMTAHLFADVAIVRLEPPFFTAVPWPNMPDPLIEPIDFNNDGQPDIYFFYDTVGMSASFSSPGQVFIVPTPPPAGHTNVYGFPAVLPFGSIIGSNVISSINLGNDLWYPGDVSDTNDFPGYGDRSVTYGYVLTEGANETVIEGGVVGTEGALPFMIYLNGQPHFAYVHFDFRNIYDDGIISGAGFGGYIEGYAYETQPGVPIVAERLNDSTPASDGLITGFNRFNGYVLTWNAVNGGTYQVQSSTNLITWTDVSNNIVANQNSITFTAVPSSSGQCFYRVFRVD